MIHNYLLVFNTTVLRNRVSDIESSALSENSFKKVEHCVKIVKVIFVRELPDYFLWTFS